MTNDEKTVSDNRQRMKIIDYNTKESKTTEVNMDKDIEDLLEKQRQQNLLIGHQIAEHADQIKEMMKLNISLPLIRGWLEEKKGVAVTLQTLRNFVVKTFGQDHYTDFVTRNGWLKILRGHQIAGHADQIKEMMETNISLPSIRAWLEEKKEVTVTLQTLRNFVVKTFGKDHYTDFVTRNGWLKTKRLEDKKRRASDAAATEISSVPVALRTEEVTELVRPPGISNAAWSDMQVKHRAAKRNNN